ncbi:MAG: ribosome maturation factor RimM [Thiohalomonadaceae bacterium]
MVESGQGKPIVVGRIAGLFGVRGWVKVYSHTQPLDNILRYSPWLVLRDGQWLPMKPLAGRLHGKGIVAHIEGCDDRDAAAALVGCDIAIVRSQLPRAEAGEIYWADLIGLQVVTLEGVELGVVDHLLETGANDVVVVRGERERLLPYVEQVIREVDLDSGLLRVDWDPEF